MRLKTRIFRLRPKTVAEAIQLAKSESISHKRFARNERIEEPMEVNHGRPRGCFHCGGPHKGRVCPKHSNSANERTRVHQIDTRDTREADRRHGRFSDAISRGTGCDSALREVVTDVPTI